VDLPRKAGDPPAVLDFGTGASQIIENKGLSSAPLIAGDINAAYHQPGLWFCPRRIASAGGIDETLRSAFDLDLTLKYLVEYPEVTYLPQTLTSFRLHETSKTSSRQSVFRREHMIVYGKIVKDQDCASLKLNCSLCLRSHRWWEGLDAIVRSSGSVASPALTIVLAMCPDPSFRMSKLSLGAVRRVLFS
jgi:hypothetical protein